ncbi:hypothetical protein P4555_22395 [Peribacillus frigoritolerans]|uniref:hypothetical protein n=1 Tax=Peribacillus frigoritolerans TaxID=450367 RepID=UPI002E1DD895|nr:hypothetical protein [Peribacillus frigoritolerans]
MEWLKPSEANNQFEDNTDSFSDFKIREFTPNSNFEKKIFTINSILFTVGLPR